MVPLKRFAYEEIERETVLFSDLAERWFDIHEAEWSKNTRIAYRGKLNNHILPTFGQRAVESIMANEIADFLNNVSSASTRSGLGILIRNVMALAVAEGHLTANPADAAKALIRKCSPDTKHRTCLPVEDVPAFYRNLSDSRPEQALKLLILTAVRVGAIAGGSREEVDGDLWIPDPARFGKGKRPPRIPLSDQAMECMDGVGVGPDSIRRTIAGQPFTVHGFRSTFRQWCQRPENNDISFEAKETALGHTIGNRTVRSYERGDWLSERRTLMQRWADYITGESGNVVALRA